MGSRQHFRNPATRQRGAVAVFVAVAIVALIAIALLALDIGRLYYTQRQLENDANMAALAGARILSGCGGPSAGTPGSLKQVRTAVLQSLTANQGNTGSLADIGTPATLLATGINGHAPVTLGRTVVLTQGKLKGIRTFQSDAAQQAAGVDPIVTDSVQVNLSTPQPKSFLASFFSDKNAGKRLYASATAQQAARGSFYLGTEIAKLNGGLLNSVLGGLLCAPGDTACQQNIVGLDVGDSLKGLAGVNLSLGQLATAAGVKVKDLSDLLTVNTTLPGILNGLSGVLAGTGDATSATAATLLKNLAAASTNPNSVPLGQILGAVDGVAASVPFINLPDLILALGEDAQAGPDGQVQPIKLPVNLNIPGVAAVNTFLKVGAPPKFSGLVTAASPQATAQTAEINLNTRLQIPLLNSVTNILNGVLALLGTSIDLGKINLGIDVHVAPASATLTQLQCPTANTPPSANLSAQTAVATVSVGTFSGDPATDPALSQTTAPIVAGKIKAVFGLVSTNIYVDLNNPLSTTVGTGGGDLNPVNQFKYCGPETTPQCTSAQPAADQPRYFLALGAPDAPPANSPNENPQTVGSSNLLSSTVSTLFTSLQDGLSTGDKNNPSKLCVLLVCLPLDKLLNPLVKGIVTTLTPVLVGTTSLVDTLLNPLLQALGVHVGTATVTMNTAVLNQPAVVSNCLPGAIAYPAGQGCPAIPAPARAS